VNSYQYVTNPDSLD